MSENNELAPIDGAAREMPEGPRVARTRRSRILMIIGVIVLLLISGVLVVQYDRNNAKREVASRQTPVHDGNTVAAADEDVIARVADEVSPSVVSITTRTSGSSMWGRTISEGAGTGILVSSDGYVLTNKHVIDQVREVSVITSDGTTYDDVKVVGADPLNDIAFLKINGASGLKAAQLGDSSTIRVGQRVVAIGNSLGQYQNTVTSGIISAVGRPISAQANSGVESLTDLLQTDAAINPGNSGGPLLNLAGQVVGVNTAIAQDAQGIGFAIPINATKGILKGVLAGKGVDRAFIGVRYIPVTAEVVKRYSLPVKNGAYVYSEDSSTIIQPGGPADKAGIKPKDIITKINGVEVGAKGGVASLVAEYQPGDTVELTVQRDGREQTLRVTLGSYKNFGS